MLFPSFAVLLANRTSRRVSETLLAELESTCRDPLEVLSLMTPGARPRLGTPSIVALIQDVSSSMALADKDRDAMIDAMRIAAEKRVEGILGNSRRRHYGHAAMLAASCVAIAPTDRGKDVSGWLAGLRANVQATSRVQRGTDASDGEPRVDASRLTPCCEPRRRAELPRRTTRAISGARILCASPRVVPRVPWGCHREMADFPSNLTKAAVRKTVASPNEKS